MSTRRGAVLGEQWSPDVGELASDALLGGADAAALADRLGVRKLVARVGDAGLVAAFESAGFHRLEACGDQVVMSWPDRVLVPHSRPFVGEAEAAAAAEVIRSRALAAGRVAAEVERAWCAQTGAADAACVASGVGALRLGLWSLGVGPGDEVIVPAYSCVALLNAVMVLGATPVLADVLPNDWTLDPTDAAARVTGRTRAVIAVNLFGMPARLAELRALGVPLVEDCAHGLGGRTSAGPFGGGGDVSMSSFYATKMIAGGEGGIVAARDAAVVARARGARDYGDQLPGAQNLNDKMTDVEAAIVREQLRRLPHMLALRGERADRYAELLAPLVQAGRAVLPPAAPGRIWYRYALLLAAGSSLEVSALMAARGVRVEQPVWDLRAAEHWGDGLEVTAEAFERVVSLPLYPDLSEREQEHVAASLLEVMGA